MKVVYIAGPYRGANAWVIEQNIRRAESLALAVWRSGAAALCPHTNTRFFQGAADDAVWLNGDLELLRRCDAVLLVEGWERSSGAQHERILAQELDLPVFDDLLYLQQWLAHLAAVIPRQVERIAGAAPPAEACSVCGCEVKTAADVFLCECPAPPAEETHPFVQSRHVPVSCGVCGKEQRFHGAAPPAEEGQRWPSMADADEERQP